MVKGAAELVLGKDSIALKEKRSAACQAISGTGALRLGAEFLSLYRRGRVYISKPTWANHRNIFQAVGLEVCEYRYWNASGRNLDFAGLNEDLSNAPFGSIIVLHACAHNPTGVDPTEAQWAHISKLIKERGHFAFFDCAYQGFASGDVDKDAWAIRYFVEQGHEVFVAQSFSKNFGLYSERTGCLTFVGADANASQHVHSQLLRLTRASISNPPAYGARIVGLILSTPALYEEWLSNVKMMANRIINMRKELCHELESLQTPGNWNHIIEQIGMFSFTGITAEQSRSLVKNHHVYLTDNGRISMAGLNMNNVKSFAKALDHVVRHD